MTNPLTKAQQVGATAPEPSSGALRNSGGPVGRLGTLDFALAALTPATASLRAPLETLRDAPQRIVLARQLHSVALSNAEGELANRDRSLSGEGEQQRRQQVMAAVYEKFDADFAAIRGDVERAHTTVMATPRPEPATGVEALLARQGLWQRARTLLEAGMSVVTLLQERGIGDNVEALFSLQAEVPIYLRANGADADPAHNFDAMIEARICEVAGPDMFARHAARLAADGMWQALQMPFNIYGPTARAFDPQRPADGGTIYATG